MSEILKERKKDNSYFGETCPIVVIPQAIRQQIYTKLLKVKSNVSLVVEVRDGLALVGVTAIDWAGLASVVIGELHHAGWNLDLLEGFAVENNGVRRGIIIAGIIIKDSKLRGDKFKKDANKLSELLKRLAIGRAGVVSLLNRSSARVECYQGILEELSRLYKNDIPDGILGKKGQLVLFISARSDQYLLARKNTDLAWIVRTNHDLVEKVRKGGGAPFYRIRNISAKGESLTGVSIVGYERDISFQNLISTFSIAWPGATISHQRKYTTKDGIVSIRLEMAGPNGLAATRTDLKVIREHLRKLLVSKGIERLHRVHHYGGTEHIGRALLPLLISECRNTSINQAYIALENITTFFAELKLLLVTNVMSENDISEHDTAILKLVKFLSLQSGIEVNSFKSPSRRRDVWIDVFDFVVEREYFDQMEDAFNIIKQAIYDSFGEFRDFDQGMRLNDVSQLNIIREELFDIPDAIVTDFYYSLEDFMRASVPVDELVQHIKLIFRTITSINPLSDINGAVNCEEVPGRTHSVATLFCCSHKGTCNNMEGLLELVRDYTVTASIVRWSGSVAVLLRVQLKGHALSKELKDSIFKAIAERFVANE